MSIFGKDQYIKFCIKFIFQWIIFSLKYHWYFNVFHGSLLTIAHTMKVVHQLSNRELGTMVSYPVGLICIYIFYTDIEAIFTI